MKPLDHFARDALADSLASIGLGPDLASYGALYEALSVAYSEPGRYYHSARHIDACLSQLGTVRHFAHRPAEIEIAIWFHDAVYDTRRSDNEVRSAAWAREYLVASGAGPDTVQRIEDMILATRTHEASAPDAALMLDIDLGILGASHEAFADYDAAIREEYAWVTEEDYRSGRAEVLRGFLRRPHIYHTAHFRQRYESAARHNLSTRIAELSEGASVNQGSTDSTCNS